MLGGDRVDAEEVARTDYSPNAVLGGCVECDGAYVISGGDDRAKSSLGTFAFAFRVHTFPKLAATVSDERLTLSYLLP